MIITSVLETKTQIWTWSDGFLQIKNADSHKVKDDVSPIVFQQDWMEWVPIIGIWTQLLTKGSLKANSADSYTISELDYVEVNFPLTDH